MPASRQARTTRTAISPRLATRTLLKRGTASSLLLRRAPSGPRRPRSGARVRGSVGVATDGIGARRSGMGNITRRGSGEAQVPHPPGQLDDDAPAGPPDPGQASPGVAARARAPQRHLALGQLDGRAVTQLAAPVQNAGEVPPVVERGG